MKAFTALVLASAGCAMVSMALVRSRVMWLGLGFPLLAIGLSMSGVRFSPRAFFQWAGRFCAERDRDCEVLWSMALDARETFRDRRQRSGRPDPLGKIGRTHMETKYAEDHFTEGA